MVATLPINRIGAHYDSPPAEIPELPASARERGKLWSDTVFQAVLALRNQLTHRDAAVVAAAANSILELERTRMRHGKLVAGSEQVSEAQLEFEADERRSDERSVAERSRAAEKKAEARPVAGRSNEQALAEHAREVAEASAASESKLQGTPVVFVRWQLKEWGVQANAIPKGGFMAYLRAQLSEGGSG